MQQNSSDSPLVQYLLTSWLPTWQSPHFIHILAYKHWWGSSPESSVPLPHNMWENRRSTDWTTPALFSEVYSQAKSRSLGPTIKTHLLHFCQIKSAKIFEARFQTAQVTVVIAAEVVRFRLQWFSFASHKLCCEMHGNKKKHLGMVLSLYILIAFNYDGQKTEKSEFLFPNSMQRIVMFHLNACDFWFWIRNRKFI